MRVALLLLLAAPLASAAPVPKSPPAEPLTADRLVGAWDYEYGSFKGGAIEFDRCGCYIARHSPDGCTYVGFWEFRDGAVTLREYYLCSDGSWAGNGAEYRFDFGKSAYPNLAGLSNGAEKVALSNPRK